LAFGVAVGGLSGFFSMILESPWLWPSFFSDQARDAIVAALGGNAGREAGPPGLLISSLVAVVGFSLAILRGLLDRQTGERFRNACSRSALRLAAVWSPATIWVLLAFVAAALGSDQGLADLASVADLVAATCLALTILTMVPWRRLWQKNEQSPIDAEAPRNRSARAVLVTAILLYVAVFTAMNWGLWFNLQIPHGDSAMYEEHLWNLEHGKGFRSYLDQGLFLGEHLQVIHLLLIPLHLLFPSHLTLEFVQSLILALGAWPVFRMARRHSGSEWAAALLGMAYLAYFPLQYLDISIDLKTFRPNSLGIPTLLAALDCLERRRYRAGVIWLALTLSAQEDYAIPLALIGLWLLFTNRPIWPETAAGRKQAVWGLSLFAFGLVYLWLAVTVIIPWFRGGAPVHTASYFTRFGATPREIVTTLVTQPGLVISTLFNMGSLLYALRLILPVAFLPLRSPGRLAVAAPLFLLLCMNDLAMQTPAPVHHFHASIIPILFWAAAAGLGGRPRSDDGVRLCDGLPESQNPNVAVERT
jgi:uncharacterized membrane protein